MSFEPEVSLSFSDLGLKPIYLSDIEHRSNIDTSIRFLGVDLSMPIISAPMSSVTNAELCNKLGSFGGMGTLPRTDNLEKDLAEFVKVRWPVIVSIPATGDYLQRAEKFLEKGAVRFCIDVANGYHTLVGKAVEELKKLFEQVNTPTYIITGNIASWEGYKYLAECGVDGVRCGIGGGSACTTSVQTAVGVGSASLIREIAENRDVEMYLDKTQSKVWPAIIADGGIKSAGDISLAIALGADLVMSGSLFAGCEESAGEVINYNGQLYKRYAGQASKAIKQNSKHVEGADTLVAYKGSLDKIWTTLSDGLCSSMAYMNSLDINNHKLIEDEAFVFLQQGAKNERLITAK